MRCNWESHIPDSFITTDIANLQAQRLFLAADAAIPEVLRLDAIENDKSVLVNLDLCVRMPYAFCVGAVQAQILQDYINYVHDTFPYVRYSYIDNVFRFYKMRETSRKYQGRMLQGFKDALNEEPEKLQ